MNTEVILRAKRGRKRRYDVDFSNGPRSTESRTVTTRCRIRELCVVLFRKWFGREPVGHWAKDGFMAEAWDKRGNSIILTQQNNEFDRFPRQRGLLLAERIA
jgi:hypothetical protein